VGGAPLASTLRIDEEGKTVTDDESPVKTPREAMDALVRLHESEAVFEVATNVRTYSSMVIESLTVDRDRDTSGAVFFSATLVHVRVVHLSGVVVEPAPTDVDKVAEPVNAGKKDTKPVTNPDHKTVLLELIEGVTGFFKAAATTATGLPTP
jgi:hypothetical protein